MITSQIAQLINGVYTNISPATSIESLYIEKAVNITSDGKFDVVRYSMYKHFPIGVEKGLYSKITENTSVANVTGQYVHIDDKQSIENIPFFQFFDSSIISAAQKHLLTISTKKHDLSRILFNYEPKYAFDTSYIELNKSLNKKCATLNGGINKVKADLSRTIINVSSLETNTNNLESSTFTLTENVSTLYKCIFDTSLYITKDGQPFEHDDIVQPYIIGGRYIMTYYPDSTSRSNYYFNIMLIAVDESTFSSKVWAIKDLSIGTDLGNSNVEQWDLRYDFPSNKLTFMKDEFGNEAPFDFKLNKTFKLNGSDYSISGKCRNNVIKSDKISGTIINVSINGDTVYNNYIGYDSSCKEAYRVTNAQNNYIGHCVYFKFIEGTSKNNIKLDSSVLIINDNKLHNIFGESNFAGFDSRIVAYGSSSHNNIKYNKIYSGAIAEFDISQSCNNIIFGGSGITIRHIKNSNNIVYNNISTATKLTNELATSNSVYHTNQIISPANDTFYFDGSIFASDFYELPS